MAHKKVKRRYDKGNVRRLLGSYAVCVVGVLCAVALAFGGMTAIDRTKTISFGEQAVAAAASPVEKLRERTVRMPDPIRELDYTPLMRVIPGLFGPVFSNLAYGAEEIMQLLRGE